MSLTLGEKLRQAREERGFTLSEVAEQTRISSLYLESIENDDYRILPGGIFNKGFVKSYAKFVGLNEQEALLDYAKLVETGVEPNPDERRVYKPQVLTDDRSASSMTPTIVFAVVILALMTGGILFLLNYLRQPSDPVVTNANTRQENAVPAPRPIEETPAAVPDMSTLKVEFKALTQPVSLSATNDGKLSTNVVTPGTVATFEPRQSLKLSYSKSLATSVQLSINGKSIGLPAVPLNPRRNVIEFEINKDNLAQIWSSGSISAEVPAIGTETNANLAPATPNTTPPPVTTPRPTGSPRPTAPVNANVRPTPRPATPRPTAPINRPPEG